MTTTTSWKDRKVLETSKPQVAFKGLKAIRHVKPGKRVVSIGKFLRTSVKYSMHRVKYHIWIQPGKLVITIGKISTYNTLIQKIHAHAPNYTATSKTSCTSCRKEK